MEEVRRTFSETIAHYRELRELCYEETNQEFASLGVRASAITPRDVADGDEWSRQWTGEKVPIWTWAAMYRDYRRGPNIKGFDLAIRSAGQLRALCIGTPSKRRLILKLHALDRAPRDNPLAGHIFRIVLFAASTYGLLLGSEELWLMDPQTENVARYYARFGFTPHRSRTGVLTHMSQKLR